MQRKKKDHTDFSKCKAISKFVCENVGLGCVYITIGCIIAFVFSLLITPQGLRAAHRHNSCLFQSENSAT